MGITFNADEIFAMAEEIERNGQKFYRKAHIRFFLRLGYILNRLGRLRNSADIADVFRALRAVIGI